MLANIILPTGEEVAIDMSIILSHAMLYMDEAPKVEDALFYKVVKFGFRIQPSSSE